tara:strand:- start:1023 stop:1589 length:567 start_codon:yes stop_codon:yes gene_type:complete
MSKTSNGNVTIVPDAQGSIIRVSNNNPEFGCVRLVQNKVAFNTQGWVRKSQLSTLIHGKVEDLQSLDLNNKTELPGQIVIKEQTEPFSASDPDRDLKIAGDTGIVCVSHGEPIYRKTFYSMDEFEQDILIAHTNGHAIKEANSDGEGFGGIEIPEEVKVKSKKKEKKEEVIEEPAEEVVEMEEETFEL